MSVRRRLRPLLAVSAALLMVSMVLVNRSLEAATGSDVDGVVTVDQPRPLAGSTVEVGLAGLTPNTDISVQLCVGFVSETPLGQPLAFPAVFAPGACRELGQLSTDAAGGAQGPVTLPTDGAVLGGLCSYDNGGSSLSFSTMVRNTCTIAAVTDPEPADGIEPLASTRVAIRTGDGSISGSLTDTDGTPLSAEDSLDLQICPLGDWGSCQYLIDSPLFERTGSTYRLDGLADGTYVVVATAYGATGYGSATPTVSVDGDRTLDLVFPTAGATSFASPGVELDVSPSGPIRFDDTIQVDASGFEPGDQVELGLCSYRPSLTVWAWAETPRLTAGCIALDGAPSTTADAGGAASFELPYSPQRFTQQCRNAFDDVGDGAGSLSFPISAQPCHLVVLDSTGAPSYAWQQLEFLSPAGAATVSGTIRADGTPIQGASARLSGPIGDFSRSTNAAGGWSVGSQPDGPFTVTGRLPSNYFFERELESGPESFSFPVTRDLVVDGAVTDQQPAVADMDFDIDPGGVTGKVLRSDGSPAEGVYVSLTAQGVRYVSLTDASRTGGTFSFFGLPAGSYRVDAYDFANFGQVTSSVIQVADGVVQTGDLRFPRTNSSISGAVVDASGSPVAGAWVSACLTGQNQNWWYGCRSATTGNDGAFGLPRLSAGTWRVIAYSPFNYLSQTTTLVEVGDDEDVTGVELSLGIDSGGIEGRVVGEDDLGIVGAAVYACTTGGSVGGCASAVSGPGGQYTISGAPDGAYSVSASAPGKVGQTIVTSVQDGEVTLGADLRLRDLNPVPPQTSVGTVDGDVSSDRAAPVFPGQPTPLALDGRCEGASVTYELRGEDGSLWASGALAEGAPGSYAGALPPLSGRSGRGELSIDVDCPEGTPDPEPVLVDVYIDPSGNVLDTEGNPVEGATVTLLRSDTEVGPFEVVPDGSDIMSPENRTNPDLTDATGYFGWLTVPGFYKVRAEKAGCRAPGDVGTVFVETPPLPVPPEQVGLELVLDCTVAPGDDTAPELALNVDDDPNAEGWTNRVVQVSAEASDGGSGVATLTLVVNGVDTGSAALVLDDGEYQVSARAVDGAGNVALLEPRTVRVDTALPDVLVASPAAGQTVVRGSVVAADYACEDAGSGVAGCVGDLDDGEPLDTSTPGPASFSVTATDRAGNTRTATVDYDVVEPSQADTVELGFTGSITGRWDGDPTSGDLRIVRSRDGVAQRVTGRVEVPGRDGGTATVRVDLRRIALFGTYLGSIRVVDRTAGVVQETPVILVRLSEAADGTLSGQTSWWGPQLRPYRLAWTFGDAG
jgi:hypothetical protein